MSPYAVVMSGGKQYRVQDDDVVRVERLDAEVGQKIDLEPVLALSDGTKLILGTPTVEKAKVASTVVEHIRAPKVVSFQKKRRKGSSCKKGHRQELTVLKIEKIAQQG